MRLTHLPVICLLLLLAACGREEVGAVPDRPFQSDGVRFSLTPSAARDCDPGTLYEAVLSWQVETTGSQRLEIRVDSTDGPLFARSDEAFGEARTGPWVRRGMWFVLVDRRSGRVLAAQRAGPEHCD